MGQKVIQVDLGRQLADCEWRSKCQCREPTLLHLNVLLASPGMAAANPFSHGV